MFKFVYRLQQIRKNIVLNILIFAICIYLITIFIGLVAPKIYSSFAYRDETNMKYYENTELHNNFNKEKFYYLLDYEDTKVALSKKGQVYNIYSKNNFEVSCYSDKKYVDTIKIGMYREINIYETEIPKEECKNGILLKTNNNEYKINTNNLENIEYKDYTANDFYIFNIVFLILIAILDVSLIFSYIYVKIKKDYDLKELL